MSKRYKVFFTMQVECEVDVDATNRDEAIEKAREQLDEDYYYCDDYRFDSSCDVSKVIEGDC